MDKVMNSIGFSKKLVVDAKNTAGGLCLMWKSSVSISLVDFSKDLIAVKVSDAIYNWILVGFYRPSYASKKKMAWENLFVLLESIHIPWVCVRDINFTTSEDEKFGGKKGSFSQKNYLQELIFEFGVIDLSFLGSKFTWAKGRRCNSAIKRRLDKAIASMVWRLAYPKATISHLRAIRSNHTPILLDSNSVTSFAHRPF